MFTCEYRFIVIQIQFLLGIKTGNNLIKKNVRNFFKDTATGLKVYMCVMLKRALNFKDVILNLESKSESA